MKVLVTGATGFVGSHVADDLLAGGHEVRCLVRPTSNLRWLEGKNVERAFGDVRDAMSLGPAVRGCDAVVHVAGVTSALSSEDYMEANARGTERLIEAACGAAAGGNGTGGGSARPIRRFVYVSSIAAAGPADSPTDPISEEREPRPVSSYGRSKLEGERACLARRERVPVSIVRPTIVYGPRDEAMLDLFKTIRRFRFRPVLTGSDRRLTLVHVRDVARLIRLALEKDHPSGDTFFVSDGNAYSYDDLAGGIARAVGRPRTLRLPLPIALFGIAAAIATGIQKITRRPAVFSLDKLKEMRPRSWLCTPARARRVLAFEPEVTRLDDGLRETAEAYRQAGWL